MGRIAKFHTIEDVAGTGHYNSASIPTNVAVRPATNLRTASGDNPSTSIYWNWNGLQDNNPSVAPGAFSTVTQADPTGTGWRCEKAIGEGVSYAAGEYWLDFFIQADTVFTSYTGDDWNYIMQLRSNGSTPSPCPSVGVQTINGVPKVILRLNISGVGSTEHDLGALDKGGAFHHYRIGFYWSTSGSVGWTKATRDGVTVLAKTFERTALDTSSGATFRVGFYRAPWVGSTPSRYRLWGGEMWNTEPPLEVTGSGTTDPPPTGRPDLPASPFSAANTMGLPTRGTEWFAATGDRIRGSVFEITEARLSSRMALPIRGSLSGSGSQSLRGVLYSVTNPDDPATDVLVVAGSDVTAAFNDEAAWLLSTFTQRTLPAGLYRACIHAGANTVTEYLRSLSGGLASAADTFTGGPAATFGLAGSPSLDTECVDVLTEVLPTTGTSGATLIKFGLSVNVNAVESGTKTAIPQAKVVGRYVDAPRQYVEPRYFHIDTGAELEWDSTAGAFYQKEN